jgi:hypothetical protein
MSEVPYELLARFNADGSVAGVHVRNLITINGKTIEGDPIPLSSVEDSAFSAFAEVFSASVVAERDALQAKVQQLTEAIPWDPRVMEAKAFVARITPSEMLSLAGSEDQQVQAIVSMLKHWVANDWPIILDSPEMQQVIGYLGQINMVTPARVAELLRDCTKEEAYVADGS